MTAKEYLNQIREKDALINKMIRQKENLKGMLYDIPSPGIGERVQTSRSISSRYEQLHAKISEKESIIDEKTDELIDLRIKICEQINELPDDVHTSVLYARYIELKAWKDIATDMKYNYNYLFHIHGAALNEFYRMYEREINPEI